MIITISKGQQITIPSSFRKELDLHVGSKIELEQKNKSLIITPIDENLDSLFAKAKKIKPKHKLSAKQMDMTLNVMAHSLVYWSRDLLNADLLLGGAKVYAMTSSGSIRVTPYYGAVSAAKAALESHVRQLALELAPYKITVNCLRAGVTFTPALRKIPGHETMIDLALSQIPFKRLTQPLDIANFIVAQATSDELWATGNVFNLDGGEITVAFHTPLKK